MALTDMRIVVVDDKPPNVALLTALLRRWGYENVVGLTDSAVALASCLEEPPDLVLLDLHMPSPDGLEILARLGPQIRAAASLPVVVLTGDSGGPAKHDLLAHGARDVLTKPFDADEVFLRVQSVLELRELQLAQRDHELELEERVRVRTEEVEEARLEVVRRLARAGEFRDDETGEHTRRVGALAALLGERLGLESAVVRDLALAAPLHDIGKIAVPDAILLKPGALTAGEHAAMRRHTVVGASILGESSSGLLELAAQVALTHHERWDGGGYPDGLTRDEIPLAGRIVAVADVFDALTHVRPYKVAWSTERARREIAAQSGMQFDPAVVHAFLETGDACLL